MTVELIMTKKVFKTRIDDTVDLFPIVIPHSMLHIQEDY